MGGGGDLHKESCDLSVIDRCPSLLTGRQAGDVDGGDVSAPEEGDSRPTETPQLGNVGGASWSGF